MYLTPTKNHWVFDAEWNAPHNTKVWIVSFKNAITKERHSFTDYDQISDFFRQGNAAGAIWVGHNILTADAPILNRLVGAGITVHNCVDTYILSCCYSPSLVGGHSVAAWAQRFGKQKPEHDDWSQFSEEMRHRNTEDVELGWEIYVKLSARMKQIGLSERFCEIEHRAWDIIQNKQKKRGFSFNAEKAHILFAELRGVEEEIKRDIYRVFPPQLQRVATYQKARKASGEPTKGYLSHLEQYHSLEEYDDGTYGAFAYVDFNLGSPKQRVEKLLELGWIPREFTPKTAKGGGGNPKPTHKGDLSPSLAEFVENGGPEEVRLIAEWIAVNTRASAVGTWLDCYNPQTGAIHGNLWLANTLRYRHDNPNTANIPAVKLDKQTKKPILGRPGLWRYEARDLWTTRDPHTRNLIGVDAVAIQFRILANALNNKEFTDVVLKGDIHSYNQSKTGIGDRNQNKTFGYAALLGAGAAKTGQIFGVDEKTGGRIKNKWIKTVPGLRELYDKLESELDKTGRIPLCDGSRVLVSSPHMVLAYLLQGDESRIMKQAMIFVDERVNEIGIDVDKVGDIHDEWQSDCSVADTKRYIEVCEGAFRDAGESFNYHLPIECSHAIGKTWAETH